MGKLFLIATPIGNLKDITLRALKVLKKVDIILCEDTRVSGKLLKEYNIRKKKNNRKIPQLLSYHEHNNKKQIPKIIKLLKQGKQIGLITNAGSPLISDPGYKLVQACLKEKIPFQTIPGPSSVITALSQSGFPPDKFIFLGYLPKKHKKRRQLLKSLLQMNKASSFNHLTFIAFESPFRLVNSLKDILETLGNIEVALCRELTKLHQQVKREKVRQLFNYFKQKKAKGEIVLLFKL